MVATVVVAVSAAVLVTTAAEAQTGAMVVRVVGTVARRIHQLRWCDDGSDSSGGSRSSNSNRDAVDGSSRNSVSISGNDACIIHTCTYSYFTLLF